MNDSAQVRAIDALDRISMVLGALYASHLGDLETGLKAERLSRCGFSNINIADLLGTTSNSVNVALHRFRSKPKKQKIK